MYSVLNKLHTYRSHLHSTTLCFAINFQYQWMRFSFQSACVIAAMLHYSGYAQHAHIFQVIVIAIWVYASWYQIHAITESSNATNDAQTHLRTQAHKHAEPELKRDPVRFYAHRSLQPSLSSLFPLSQFSFSHSSVVVLLVCIGARLRVFVRLCVCNEHRTHLCNTSK